MARVRWKRAAWAIFQNGGGLDVVRGIHRKGLRVLTYHRFSSAAELEPQCRHIRENYHPVSLPQVDSWLRGGDPLPANSIAVTIDDGYRDAGEVALPVFRAWEIP